MVRAQLNALGGPLPKAPAHVIAADDKVPSIVCLAAHQDVDMRIVAVPVVDGHPVELRSEVALRVLHHFAGESAEVRHLGGILGRDDEPEMVPVLRAALRERLPVRAVQGRVDEARFLAVASYAFSLEVGDMLGEGRRDEASAALANDTRHDHDATAGRMRRQRKRRPPASPEGGSRLPCLSFAEGLSDVTCLLGGPHDLADEAPRTLGTVVAGPDAAWPDPNFIVAAGHGGRNSCRRRRSND